MYVKSSFTADRLNFVWVYVTQKLEAKYRRVATSGLINIIFELWDRIRQHASKLKASKKAYNVNKFIFWIIIPLDQLYGNFEVVELNPKRIENGELYSNKLIIVNGNFKRIDSEQINKQKTILT